MGSPSNTKSPGLQPSSIPSDILIDAAIWPQQIWTENWGASPTWLAAAISDLFIVVLVAVWLTSTSVICYA